MGHPGISLAFVLDQPSQAGMLQLVTSTIHMVEASLGYQPQVGCMDRHLLSSVFLALITGSDMIAPFKGPTSMKVGV